jgi:aspartyl/asparaginyl beta-hydroxylase (cupin superfamily)
MSKLWFSVYDFSFNYRGPEPAFADPGQFDWATDIANHTDDIDRELRSYIASHQLETYFNTSMVDKKNSWRTIALKTWNIVMFKNQKQFPVTSALINKYPQIVSASFNLLEPGSKILPHCGDTNAIYRCHLGLEVPAGLPETGFKVKEESRPWEKGKWIIFMDAYQHEAWNNSEGRRYIFLIDVVRDEFRDKTKTVCATVRTSLFIQKRLEIFNVDFSSYPRLIPATAKVLQPFIRIAIKLVNVLKVY